MGSSIAQVASSTQPQGQSVGKGFASPAQQPVQQDAANIMAPAAQPTRQGKGGSVTLPGQGGQPKMGQPNMYPNTVGQWDNATIGTQQYQAPPRTFQQPQQNGKVGTLGERLSRGKGV